MNDVLFFLDTGFFLTLFLAYTSKKAGFTKASSIVSLLLMKNRLNSMQWAKWRLSQALLIIHKVRNLSSFYLSGMKYNQDPFGNFGEHGFEKLAVYCKTLSLQFL